MSGVPVLVTDIPAPHPFAATEGFPVSGDAIARARSPKPDGDIWRALLERGSGPS